MEEAHSQCQQHRGDLHEEGLSRWEEERGIETCRWHWWWETDRWCRWETHQDQHLHVKTGRRKHNRFAFHWSRLDPQTQRVLQLIETLSLEVKEAGRDDMCLCCIVLWWIEEEYCWDRAPLRRVGFHESLFHENREGMIRMGLNTWFFSLTMWMSMRYKH